MSVTHSARRLELGRFLRVKRSALTPEALGIRRSRRRRSIGLLREEVAKRASGALLDRLARTLQLDEAERAHLFALARHELSDVAPASLTHWLIGLEPHPACVHNGIWQVLAWNDAAVRLFGDFGAKPECDRNILKLIFLNSHWRSLLIDWELIAVGAAAQFRAQAARYAGHPVLAELIADFLVRSDDFAHVWEANAVDGAEIWTKRIAHAELGALALDYASLKPAGVAEDPSVVIYSPGPGTLSASTRSSRA